MESNKMPKLVRDKIPDIIRAGGQECDIEILSDEEYIKALDAKLYEEFVEYHDSYSVEELADILTVILAIIHARGYSMDRLKEIFVEKADKRGRFDKRILLKKVHDKEKKDE